MTIEQLPSIAACRLWHVDLDATTAVQSSDCLSDDESARATRFVFERDRRRYVAAHVALRQTLAMVTGKAPAELTFELGAFGKPALAGQTTVHFNLSHSAGAGLIAINDSSNSTSPSNINANATEVGVGVDVEVLRPMSYSSALAAEYFTLAEQQGLTATAPPDRDLAFLTCWTRKEACLKALGLGLSIDTRSFEVGVCAASAEVVMAVAGRSATVHVHSFRPRLDLVCAVARVVAEPITARLAAHLSSALIEREFA